MWQSVLALLTHETLSTFRAQLSGNAGALAMRTISLTVLKFHNLLKNVVFYAAFHDHFEYLKNKWQRDVKIDGGQYFLSYIYWTAR